jgi:hypothetical protein
MTAGYMEWGNVWQKIRNQFHAKDATIAKWGSTMQCFFSESFFENLQETPFSPFSVPALLFDPTVATFAPVA